MINSKPIFTSKQLLMALGQSLIYLSLSVDIAVSSDQMFPYTIVENTIPRPLTTVEGNMTKGQLVFVDRQRGHCLLCHTMSTIDEPFQGNLGPDLSNIGLRMTVEQIRLQIVDPSRLNPDSIMPAYYRTNGLHQVAESYRDKPILTGQEIEDLIAFLMSLGQREGAE